MSMMASKVTIIGKRPRLVPREEPEISELLGRELLRWRQMKYWLPLVGALTLI